VEALKQEICDLFEAMPMDLQQTLLLSPARAMLIQVWLVSFVDDCVRWLMKSRLERCVCTFVYVCCLKACACGMTMEVR
jgi:hypothetical protein